MDDSIDGLIKEENNNNASKQARYCFQYFDEACDVGIENENGERVRKRKRPGRKPNPPSQQERRAQNRMAQRNFREREQQKRQEREKQWKEYIEELSSLRKRVAIAEYEANYLRGWVLQLLLSSIALRGSVPQVWVDTRTHPLPHPTMMPTPLNHMKNKNRNNSHNNNNDKDDQDEHESQDHLDDQYEEASQIPAILDLVLNEDTKTILNIQKAMEVSDHNNSSTCPLVNRATIARQRQQKFFKEPINIPPPPTSTPTPCNFKSIQELLDTDIMSLNTDCQDIRFTFPRKLSPAIPHLSTSSSSPTTTTTTTTTTSQQQQSTKSYHSNKNKNKSKRDSISDNNSTLLNNKNKKQRGSPILSSPPTSSSPTLSHHENDFKSSPTMKSSTSTTTTVSIFKNQPAVKVLTTELPTLQSPEDLSNLPSLQALHILRLQLKIGSLIGEKIHYALSPTALQRIIPHDLRIDYVPSGSIRDKMIIFQDYFDMDECFQLFTNHSVFVGGDIRDSRNWVLDPIVTEKYWFFSHHLYDHHFDDCHISEDFMDELREWTMKKYQIGSPLSTTHTTTSSSSASSLSNGTQHSPSSLFNTMPAPTSSTSPSPPIPTSLSPLGSGTQFFNTTLNNNSNDNNNNNNSNNDKSINNKNGSSSSNFNSLPVT